jgi:hypothetical protein
MDVSDSTTAVACKLRQPSWAELRAGREREIETAMRASRSSDPELARAGRIALSLLAAQTHSAEPTAPIDGVPASPSRGQAADLSAR